MEQFNEIESYWRFYFDTLFSDYSEYPFFYSEEELAILDGTNLKDHIEEKKEDLISLYNSIVRVFPSLAE